MVASKCATLTVIVSIIPAIIVKAPSNVCAVSNTPSLSSCISLLYAKGNPFRTVSKPTKSPYTRPVLPRINSAISGFFFWGIILEPVANVSDNSMNLNSSLLHKISSSQKRERCIMTRAALLRYSTEKSRSLTASKLFAYGFENPSNSALRWRSIGKVVPAKAPAPKGNKSIRLILSSNRPLSRSNIQK